VGVVTGLVRSIRPGEGGGRHWLLCSSLPTKDCLSLVREGDVRVTRPRELKPRNFPLRTSSSVQCSRVRARGGDSVDRCRSGDQHPAEQLEFVRLKGKCFVVVESKVDPQLVFYARRAVVQKDVGWKINAGGGDSCCLLPLIYRHAQKMDGT
jgi:hypothetical protein